MRTYLSIVGLFNLAASLIWGVNTLFLLAAGLTLTEAFIANAFYTLGMVIFEIPTGVVADTLGRRVSFLSSLWVLLAGTIAYVALYWIGAGLVWWAVASIILGLGFTFYSGAVEAWVVDAMKAVDPDRPMERVFARGGQMQGAAMLAGTLGGGLLAVLDLAVPYVVRAALLILCIMVAGKAMRDIGFAPRAFRVAKVPEEMRIVARDSIRDGWRNRAVRPLMLIGMLHWGFLIWGWYAWQPHFVDLFTGGVWIVGVIAAAVSVTMVIGNGAAPGVSRLVGDRSFVLMLAGTAFVVALAGFSLATTFWSAAVWFLAAMAAFAIHEPVRGAMLHALIPSRTRATVVSFAGLLASAAGVVSQVALADHAERNGIPEGYAVGALFLVLGVPLAFVAGRRGPEACDPTTSPAPPAEYR